MKVVAVIKFTSVYYILPSIREKPEEYGNNKIFGVDWKQMRWTGNRKFIWSGLIRNLNSKNNLKTQLLHKVYVCT